MDKVIDLSPLIGEPASIAEHLRFDALATAEKLTGQSYKEDKETQMLGLAMHVRAGARKTAVLTAADDTTFSDDTNRYLRIIQEEGFVEVLRLPFDGQGVGDGYNEMFFVYHHPDGLLLSFDTFGGDHVNSGHIYFNISPRDQNNHRWPDSVSGGFTDGVLIGGIDCREAVRHHLSQLRAFGTFVAPWVKPPFLWLLHYSEKNTGDYKALNRERIALLPDNVRAMIGEYT